MTQPKPLSYEARSVIAASIGCNNSKETVAQAFRALAFLKSEEPVTRGLLIRIAEELDP